VMMPPLCQLACTALLLSNVHTSAGAKCTAAGNWSFGAGTEYYYATAQSADTFQVVRHPPPAKGWANATVTATGSQLSTIYNTGQTDTGLLDPSCQVIDWADDSTWYRPGGVNPGRGKVKAVTVKPSVLPIGTLCRALKRKDCPLGVVDGAIFGLTADSSSFLTVDAGNGRWELLGSQPLHNMLAGLAPLTFRVGGTFTDFTSMPGPNPGVSKHEPNQYNFSEVGWAAMNDLVDSLPGSQLVVSLNGLLRHWDQANIPWDSTNAEAFILDNIAKGYQIYGYELGNEPGCWGSHGGAVPARVHAEDFGVLQGVLARAYPDPATRPLVIGPDTTGCGGPGSSSPGR
jgi:hypothetical protein